MDTKAVEPKTEREKNRYCFDNIFAYQASLEARRRSRQGTKRRLEVVVNCKPGK
jgi:hypothetical protein